MVEQNRRTGENKDVLRTLAWCQAQWEVYRMAIKHFYGVEYHFTRTDECFGLCTEDESDFLFKKHRELQQSSRYEATKEDVAAAAIRKAERLQEVARSYKDGAAEHSDRSPMELVLGRAAEIGKITL